MKYFPLLWASLTRNALRTLLMVLSLIVGFLLFGILHGIDTAFDVALGRMRLDRLIAEPRFSEPPLPRSYPDRMARVPGVIDVTWTVFLLGSYQDPKNDFLIVATEPRSFLRIRNEFEVSAATVDALTRTRSGVILLESQAQRYGLKVGDQFTIQTPQPRQNGSSDWTFNVVGLMRNPSNPGGFGFGLANYDYFDESRMTARGTVGRIVVRVDNPTRSAGVSKAIDQLFQSSAAPTRTKTENESARTQLAIIGNIGLLTRGVIAAVFLAILFLTANTVLQSVRERSREIAVLKVLGFSDPVLMVLVFGETLLICGASAVAGITLAAIFFPQVGEYIPNMAAYLPPTPMSGKVFGAGLLVATLLAVLSSAVPAWRTLRLRVVDALMST